MRAVLTPFWFQEAQNRVAAFALYRLFPDMPIQFLIPEPYTSLVIEWEEGQIFSFAISNTLHLLNTSVGLIFWC